MRICCRTACLFFVFAVMAYGAGDGGYAGAFLRNGIGARPLGMGGAYTAIAEGPEATYYNPAGIGFVPSAMVSFSYKTLSLGRHFGHVALTFPVKNEAAMAASWVNAGVSDVVGRGESRQVLGEIRNHQNAFAVSFAKAASRVVSFGASLRYLQEKIDKLSSFTIGVDVGLIVRPDELFAVGGVVENLGSSYRWDSRDYWSDGGTHDDKFPYIFKLGLAGFLLSETLTPAVDVEFSDKEDPRLRAGVEYWFVRKIVEVEEDEFTEGVYHEVEKTVRWASLRAGLDRGEPTFGLSYIQELKPVSMSLEYAYLVGRQGTSGGHLFTLVLSF